MDRPSADVLDPQQIRRDFPILGIACHQKPLVYLDNAATTQKPKVVIDAESHYYNCQNANIHRGIHTLAEKATRAFEDTRLTAQAFLGASSHEEIIFVRGVTDLRTGRYPRCALEWSDCDERLFDDKALIRRVKQKKT